MNEKQVKPIQRKGVAINISLNRKSANFFVTIKTADKIEFDC